MLCRRKITLPPDAHSLSHGLIPREVLADCTQAEHLLTRAKAQADALLNRAQLSREALLEQAGQAFWQRANAQLHRWENEQKALCDNLERYITGVVNQAIRHLLDETPQPQRLAALLKQLLASQVPEVNALLLCHPREIEALKHCLSRHDAARWRVQPDDTISTQTLRYIVPGFSGHIDHLINRASYVRVTAGKENGGNSSILQKQHCFPGQ